MANNKLIDILKEERNRGTKGAAVKTVGNKLLEQIDPRRIFDKQEFLKEVFPFLKSYDAVDSIKRKSERSPLNVNKISGMKDKLSPVPMEYLGDNDQQNMLDYLITIRNNTSPISDIKDDTRRIVSESKGINENLLKIIEILDPSSDKKFFKEAKQRENERESLFQKSPIEKREKLSNTEHDNDGILKKISGAASNTLTGGIAGGIAGATTNLIASMFGSLFKLVKFIFNPKNLIKLIGRFGLPFMIVGSIVSGIKDGIEKWKQTSNLGEAIVSGLSGIIDFITFGIIDEEKVRAALAPIQDFTSRYIIEPIMVIVGAVKNLFAKLVEAKDAFKEKVKELIRSIPFGIGDKILESFENKNSDTSPAVGRGRTQGKKSQLESNVFAPYIFDEEEQSEETLAKKVGKGRNKSNKKTNNKKVSTSPEKSTYTETESTQNKDTQPVPQKDSNIGPKEAFDYFVSKGWSPAQAAGIVGNLMAESGESLQNNAVGDGGAAYGIAQWHPDRQENFKKYKGFDIRRSSTKDQLDFVHYEMTQGKEKRAGRLLATAEDPREAAELVDKYYERSDGTHREKRMDYAQNLIQTSGGVSLAALSPNHSSTSPVVEQSLLNNSAVADTDKSLPAASSGAGASLDSGSSALTKIIDNSKSNSKVSSIALSSAFHALSGIVPSIPENANGKKLSAAQAEADEVIRSTNSSTGAKDSVINNNTNIHQGNGLQGSEIKDSGVSSVLYDVDLTKLLIGKTINGFV